MDRVDVPEAVLLCLPFPFAADPSVPRTLLPSPPLSRFVSLRGDAFGFPVAAAATAAASMAAESRGFAESGGDEVVDEERDFVKACRMESIRSLRRLVS